MQKSWKRAVSMILIALLIVPASFSASPETEVDQDSESYASYDHCCTDIYDFDVVDAPVVADYYYHYEEIPLYRTNADLVAVFDWGISYIHFSYTDEPEIRYVDFDDSIRTETDMSFKTVDENGFTVTTYVHTYGSELDEAAEQAVNYVVEWVVESALLHERMRQDIQDFVHSYLENSLNFSPNCIHEMVLVSRDELGIISHPNYCLAWETRYVFRCRCGFTVTSYSRSGFPHIWTSWGVTGCNESCPCGARRSIPCDWVNISGVLWCRRCGRGGIIPGRGEIEGLDYYYDYDWLDY